SRPHRNRPRPACRPHLPQSLHFRGSIGPAAKGNRSPARMTRPPKAILSWSSGKDAAFALHEMRRTGAAEIVGLLTTVNETHERVAMHGVRERLLDLQAEAAGLP